MIRINMTPPRETVAKFRCHIRKITKKSHHDARNIWVKAKFSLFLIGSFLLVGLEFFSGFEREPILHKVHQRPINICCEIGPIFQLIQLFFERNTY